jgi:hypothetical protein
MLGASFAEKEKKALDKPLNLCYNKGTKKKGIDNYEYY